MERFHCSISLYSPRGLKSKDFEAIDNMFLIQTKNVLSGEDWLQCYSTETLETKYKWTEVIDVTDKLTHVNAHQKADLLKALKENSEIVD